jgi:1-acyl-sn-glycerol-3-phosphate acyltransferase
VKRPSEPLLTIWGRRAITWPLFATVATVVWGALPAWLALALVADLLARAARRRPITRTVAMVAIYLACELAGVIAAGAIFLLTLFASERTKLRANAALQRAWSGALFRGIRTIFAMSFEVEGAELAAPAPLLLFVRHSSTADTLLAAAVVANPHAIVLRYVLKRELLWDPCLDLVGRRLPNAFVDRSGESRDAQLEAVASLAEDLGDDAGVLIYPEGTRFTDRKRASALAHLEAEGRADLAAIARDFTHVLPPRLGGPLRLLEAMRGVDVVFLDQCGFEGARSFASLVRGALVGSAIRVRLRRVEAARVPRERLDVWLFEQWRETNAWVAAHQGAHAR